MNTKELKQLGFETAGKKVEEQQELMIKLHFAYQDYEFVTQEDIDKFNEQLRKQTEKKEGTYTTIYDVLKMIKIKDYTEAPPEDVLEKLKKAKADGCFDEFVIAKIESVKEVEDPILFGRIIGCGDYFFIAQWDDDVTMEMIKSLR